jgi:hypothetical protein
MAPALAGYHDGSPRYACSHVGEAPRPPLFESVPVALKVTLTEAEIEQALACGQKRIEQAERHAMQDRLSEYSLRSHRLGALGERAYAKWIGVPWRCGMRGFGGKPDVAGAQIRAIARPDQRLVVHTNDPGKVPVVLVTTHGRPVFEIRGWIRAADAQKEEWLDDPGSKRLSFFVPQRELRDPAELRTYA